MNEAGAHGLFYGGGSGQVGSRAVAVLATIRLRVRPAVRAGLVGCGSVGSRVGAEAESNGIDEAGHAETADDFAPLTSRATGRTNP